MKLLQKGLLTLTVVFLLISSATVQVTAKQVGTFSSTGSMSQARAFHSTTLLKDGRVLVAGGFSITPPFFPPAFPIFFSGAEIYDPHTGTWASTGSMLTPRAAHTGTLLRDGRVLVAGGENLFGTTATAEIYNPNSGTWSATGSMSGGRTEAAALLLEDGRVLVAGGETFTTGPVATAELYNPKTGTWSSTGTMNVPRTEIVLVPLGEEKVLVAGGATSGNPVVGFTSTATAEIYNTETGSWTLTGSMAVPRIDASAVSLGEEGMVLAAGGRTAGAESTPFTYLNSAELYNPKTGTWSTTGSMTHPHGEAEFATVVLRDGTVLLTGGFKAFETPQSSAELYNPKTGTWTSMSMSSVRSGHTATLLKNGNVLVVGGLTTPPTATASSELFVTHTQDD